MTPTALPLSVKRVVICGARAWENEEIVDRTVARVISKLGTLRLLIITGGAPGVDTIAEKAARARGVHVARVDALWDTYGRQAGPARNGMMLALRPHLVIGLHYSWDESRGTVQCLDHAERLGIKTRRVTVSRLEAHPSAAEEAARKAAKRKPSKRA